MRLLVSSPLSLRIAALGFLLCATFHLGIAAGPVTGFVARDGAIQLVRDGEATPVFVHAVNLGVGIPGKQPGELAVSREQYDRWFARMAIDGIQRGAHLHAALSAVLPGAA